MVKQLTRDEFRESIFKRDGSICVFCKEPAVDAHHLMERRLFGSSQGYFISNGISVCGKCHLLCEQTKISVEEGRAAASIKEVVLPTHLQSDQIYDKWANPVMDNGSRLKGELFHDESVQKILELGGMLPLFTNRVKYPKTMHAPWSPGLCNDDRLIEDISQLIAAPEVIVTEKMDGEGVSCYSDYMHARSLEYHQHPSRNWMKALHGSIAGDIPEGYRICGESMFAKHSLAYEDLPDYFLVFSVWSDRNECLSWDDTIEWATLLGLNTVPVIYRGPYDEAKIRSLYREPYDEKCEGYVIRDSRSFHYKEFKTRCMKFVRKGHVQTSSHWRNQPVVPNKLRAKS